MANLEHAYANLQNDLRYLENDNSGLLQRFPNLKNDSSTLENDSANRINDFPEGKIRLPNLPKDISNLQNEFPGLEHVAANKDFSAADKTYRPADIILSA